MMYRNKGFTLIELMIAVAVVGILSAVALPYYGDYVIRSKAPQGQTALSTFLAHMEQRYQDTGNYGTNNKCVLTPADTQNFTMACTLGANGQSFTATATGKGQMAGITYEIDSSDTRKTKAHPKGLPTTNCWTTKGVVCD